MNLGFEETDSNSRKIPLEILDEKFRSRIQLYRHVIGNIDLSGKKILDVGSGRGGGTFLISQHFQPGSITGLEIAEAAIKFCRKHYGFSEIHFIRGDAHHLPFKKKSFDIVLNIESANLYHSLSKFIREITKILRPRT